MFPSGFFHSEGLTSFSNKPHRNLLLTLSFRFIEPAGQALPHGRRFFGLDLNAFRRYILLQFETVTLKGLKLPLACSWNFRTDLTAERGLKMKSALTNVRR